MYIVCFIREFQGIMWVRGKEHSTIQWLNCMCCCGVKTIAQLTYFYKDVDTFLTTVHPPPVAVVILAVTTCPVRASTVIHINY